MKKMRKAVSILLAGCLVLGLSACGGTKNAAQDAVSQTASGQKEDGGTAEPAADSKTADAGEKVEISFSMAAYSNEVDGWTAMIDEANRQLEAEGKNIAIKINKVPCTGWPEYYQKVITQMAGCVITF